MTLPENREVAQGVPKTRCTGNPVKEAASPRQGVAKAAKSVVFLTMGTVTTMTYLSLTNRGLLQYPASNGSGMPILMVQTMDSWLKLLLVEK
ncbi:MAG: hypothetical protein ACYC6N_30700 [Pirellulaceae bacterium]